MMRKCIGVVILDDMQTETVENFQVFIEESGGISTNVTIIDKGIYAYVES